MSEQLVSWSHLVFWRLQHCNMLATYLTIFDCFCWKETLQLALGCFSCGQIYDWLPHRGIGYLLCGTPPEVQAEAALA